MVTFWIRQKTDFSLEISFLFLVFSIVDIILVFKEVCTIFSCNNILAIFEEMRDRHLRANATVFDYISTAALNILYVYIVYKWWLKIGLKWMNWYSNFFFLTCKTNRIWLNITYVGNQIILKVFSPFNWIMQFFGVIRDVLLIVIVLYIIRR